MILQKINAFFPFRKLLTLLIALAIIVQLIVISYNHMTEFYVVENSADFILRLSWGSMLSFIAALFIAIPDLLIIKLMNRFFQWNKKVLLRVLIQLSLIILIALLISVLITLFANWLSAFKEDLVYTLVYNAIFFIVVNIILVAILEAWLFFIESDNAKLMAKTLEKELSQVRFEVLKSQINPHFMFNSLNVLSGLIEKDITKAQQFIDEFSRIYRYVLETIEKPVVPLNEELGFIRSYIFLQQIRYGEALILNINLPSSLLKMLLPPLSLQTVLENAIKHNVVNVSQPLQIDIYLENKWLVVKNNIQQKISSNVSTGLGQSNMVKRYALIGENIPQFIVEANNYIVKLPLIKNEDHESINY